MATRQKASALDSLPEEISGYASAVWKDLTPFKGFLATMDKLRRGDLALFDCARSIGSIAMTCSPPMPLSSGTTLGTLRCFSYSTKTRSTIFKIAWSYGCEFRIGCNLDGDRHDRRYDPTIYGETRQLNQSLHRGRRSDRL